MLLDWVGGSGRFLLVCLGYTCVNVMVRVVGLI